ncbi:MAG: GNAT family N-acetyltransferase [Omnitrophica WOR_2 bacterium]
MPELETPRLRLIALTPGQLSNYLTKPDEFELQLGYPVSRVNLSDQVQQAMAAKISKMSMAVKEDYPWYTYWLVVTKITPFGAGLAGYKGAPNFLGQVEIGYSMDPSCQNQGYMTEAVRALVNWAFQSNRCQSITAETIRWNYASRRVLEKTGFVVVSEKGEAVYWEIRKWMRVGALEGHETKT